MKSSRFLRKFRARAVFLAAAGLLVAAAGCKSSDPATEMDFSGDEWETRKGQVVWWPGANRPAVVTDILFAKHEEGTLYLHVSKEVMPLISVRSSRNAWLIESPMEQKSFTGKGPLPSQSGWAQLLRALNEQSVHGEWRLRDAPEGRIRLSNELTGERMEATLDP